MKKKKKQKLLVRDVPLHLKPQILYGPVVARHVHRLFVGRALIIRYLGTRLTKSGMELDEKEGGGGGGPGGMEE